MSSHLAITIGLLVVFILLAIAHAIAERKEILYYVGNYICVFMVLFIVFFDVTNCDTPSFYVPVLIVLGWLALLFLKLFGPSRSEPTTPQVLQLAAASAIVFYVYIGAPGFGDFCARVPSMHLFG